MPWPLEKSLAELDRQFLDFPTSRTLRRFSHVAIPTKPKPNDRKMETPKKQKTSTRKLLSPTEMNLQLPLFQLPAEIRLMIWELVLGNQHVVVRTPLDNTPSRGHFSVISYPWKSDFKDNPAEWTEEALWNGYRNCNHAPGECPVKGLPLDLLLTCRTIYLEAWTIPFKRNNFVFTCYDEAYTFHRALSREQKSWIRNVTIIHDPEVSNGSIKHCFCWFTEKPRNFAPYTNRLNLQFVTFFGCYWVDEMVPLQNIRLDTFPWQNMQQMVRNFARGNPDTKYEVAVDCDSSLLRTYFEKFPFLSREELKRLLGVTEEEKQGYLEGYRRMIEE